MKRENRKEYEDCTQMISDLIAKWERLRPDEELTVLVLPKYDLKERRARLEEISRQLLQEEW